MRSTMFPGFPGKQHVALRPRRLDRPPKHDVQRKDPGAAIEGDNKLLMMELTELNIFARHHFQLYLSWYTFFLTVNFVAIGWFTSVLLTGALKASMPVLLIGGFFVVQLVLSYLGSSEVITYFEQTRERCDALLNSMVMSPSEAHLRPQSPIPIQVYLKIIRLICYTLISFGIFWIAISAISVYLVPL